MKRFPKILFIVVLAQFCCTSIWFAGNAIMAELVVDFNLPATALGHLTSSVQFGFITGTLLFALLSVADRFSPSKVFFVSALFAALFNLTVTLPGNNFLSLLALRFLAGFCLAGIYPVGMKIAADYFEKGLGKSLGFLVGALVLGTAFPHLLNAVNTDLSWSFIIYATSFLALSGGTLIVFFVPDGPFRKPGQALKLNAIISVFKPKAFRIAAFGYFGHMWELYTFWAFVPLLLTAYNKYHSFGSENIALLSFLIIAIGSAGCVLAGYLANKYGAGKTAFSALFVSAACCFLLPVFFLLANPILYIVFLLVWGMAVVADSPMFSTMVAQNAIPHFKGTALTIVNSIGFAITIGSIQLVNLLLLQFGLPYIFMILAIGPIAGLVYRKVS